MLSEKANKIFKLKYARNGEEWSDTCWRVASYVASVEDNKEEYEKKFFEIIFNKVFIPGGRVLANSGTGIKNLMNCFVLGLNDSRESIYGTLQDAAEIFAHGGGCGYNFSNIREQGADVISTGGIASGPISFMSLFDQTGEVISQASRRGAQMAFLNCTHPDIENFINYKSTPNPRNRRILDEYKRNLKLVGLNSDGRKYFSVLEKTLQDDQLSHFNISVMLNDDFMNASRRNLGWNLISSLNNKPHSTINSTDLLNLIASMAWESGDPGVAFYNRINEDNVVNYLGDLSASNPCSELFLLPNESCCLGSINLLAFADENSPNKINLPFLEYIVRLAVRFLDNVQTVSDAPLEKINEVSKGLRRLGLGVMGWADLLAQLEIPYDSEEAKIFGKRISWFISFFAWMESINLSKERGSFPLYDREKANLSVIEKTLNSSYTEQKFDMNFVRQNGIRNVAITSIAPTGTISILADVNSGIEPFFALAYKRNITEGIGNTAKDSFIEINPILFEKLKKYGVDESDIKEIKKEILKTGSVQHIEKIPENIKRLFRNAHEISPYDHVDMQASWQRHVDNSISKTINLPEDATKEDIKNIIDYGWNSGIKSMTVYRDKSKSFQILNVGE